MSDDPFSTRCRSRRRTAANAPHGRRLELVTDSWIDELAELVALQPRASREVDDVPPTPAPGTDRDPRSLRPLES